MGSVRELFDASNSCGMANRSALSKYIRSEEDAKAIADASEKMRKALVRPEVLTEWTFANSTKSHNLDQYIDPHCAGHQPGISL